MGTILELNGIKKYYGKKEVLKGIGLQVEEGQVISVLGPSGCGKSTLLNIIAGILPLDEGSVRIYGKEVSSHGKMIPIEERNINMVFQDFALWPHMKARDNILYGLKVRRVDKDEQEKRLQEVVSLLHLEGLLNQFPAELSGGQQQRVAIARALVTKPAIILLDEPLCNLDVQLRIEMRTEMAQLFRHLKTTVFHVTHDPSEAFAMADRIIVMNQGNIDQNGKPEECYKMPKTAVVAGLLGAGNRLDGTMLSERDEDRVQIRTAGIVVWCMNFIGKKECGTVAELRFRPEDGRFCEETGSQRIPVQVQMSSFEGGQYRVRVCTEQNQSFCLLHPEFLPEGMKGFVEIPAERLYAYEKISG